MYNRPDESGRFLWSILAKCSCTQLSSYVGINSRHCYQRSST